MRLVATTVVGNGTIDVSGGGPAFSMASPGTAGSSGRIRIEALTNTSALNMSNASSVSVGQPGALALTNAPVLQITSVAGTATPSAPTASYSQPDIVLPATTTNPVTISIAASNIPVGTAVTVKVVGQTGAPTSVTSAGLSGTLASSTTSVAVTIPTNQPSVISASVTFTATAWNGSRPLYAEGEEVERVAVSAGLGRVQEVTYITKSGREIVAAAR